MSPARRRAGLVGVGALGLVLAGPALGGSVALGHAQLVSSEPAASKPLLETPTEIRLVFSEPIEPSYTSINLKDAEDNSILAGVGEPDPNDPYTLVVPLEALADGPYLVEWRALSAADSHTTQGFLSFAIRDIPLDHSLEADGGTHSLSGADGHGGYFDVASPFEIAARAIAYLGILLAFGLWVIGRFVVRPTYGRLPRGLVVAQAWALGLAALGGLALAIQVSIRTGLDPISILFGSRSGLVILERIVVGLVGVAIVVVLIRVGRLGWASATAGLAGFVSVVLLAEGGHASAFAEPGPMAAMIVHLSAASVWLAGLLALGIIARRRDRPPMAAIVPRFSALALLAIALLAATGLYADWTQTRDVLSIATGYQFYLAVKIAIVLAALALGGLNLLDGGQAKRWFGGLKMRLGLEMGLAVAILVVTANLGSGFPPVSDLPIPLAPAPTSAQIDHPSTVSLEIGPGRPGPNRFRALVSPPPKNRDIVAIVLDRLDRDQGSQTLYLEPENEDPAARTFYVDGGIIPAGSRWNATVTVTRRDTNETTGETDLAELAYVRYEFELGEEGLIAGRKAPPLDLGFVVGLGLLCLGVLGAVYAVAGGSLPLVHARTSRIALAGGGLVGVFVGLTLVAFTGAL